MNIMLHPLKWINEGRKFANTWESLEKKIN
jgi:hypothetical protein